MEPAVTQTEEPVVTIADPFKNLVDLMAVYSAARNELTELEAQGNGLLLDLVDDSRADYARLQKILMDAEEAMEAICRQQSQWFTEKRSVTTPYGEVKFHKSSKVVVDNEELTILLIEKHAAADPKFDPSLLVIPTKKLSLEALEKLEPELLAAFRVVIEKKDNFSVKEATLDMGKAVQSVDKKKADDEKKAAKQAKKEGK